MSRPSSVDDRAVEWIVRRAEAMGLDPQRVVRALGLGLPKPPEYRAVEELPPRSRFGRRSARGS